MCWLRYMTGTSVRREANEEGEAEQSGLLKFYKTATLQQAHQIGFATGFPQRRDYMPCAVAMAPWSPLTA